MKSDSFIYLHWNVFFLMDSVQFLSCIKGSFGTRTHTHALTNTHTHRRKTLLGGASCYEGQRWARNRQQVEGRGCSWCGGVSRQLRHLLLIWMRLVLTFKPTFLFFLFTSFPVSSLLYLFSPCSAIFPPLLLALYPSTPSTSRPANAEYSPLLFSVLRGRT